MATQGSGRGSADSFMLGGDCMGTLKVSSKEPMPRTHCLPQEACTAVGLGVGTAGLTLAEA